MISALWVLPLLLGGVGVVVAHLGVRRLRHEIKFLRAATADLRSLDPHVPPLRPGPVGDGRGSASAYRQ